MTKPLRMLLSLLLVFVNASHGLPSYEDEDEDMARVKSAVRATASGTAPKREEIIKTVATQKFDNPPSLDAFDVVETKYTGFYHNAGVGAFIGPLTKASFEASLMMQSCYAKKKADTSRGKTWPAWPIPVEVFIASIAACWWSLEMLKGTMSESGFVRLATAALAGFVGYYVGCAVLGLLAWIEEANTPIFATTDEAVSSAPDD
ncbi:hypothetical protein LTR53_014455 [Teratosphaeriaceae sp. CCFEE 6253]|nr:hypothetical protein LTR53_014455 [Teratosphaeriaceae sp. CCFEE 6253]